MSTEHENVHVQAPIVPYYSSTNRQEFKREQARSKLHAKPSFPPFFSIFVLYSVLRHPRSTLYRGCLKTFVVLSQIKTPKRLKNVCGTKTTCDETNSVDVLVSSTFKTSCDQTVQRLSYDTPDRGSIGGVLRHCIRRKLKITAFISPYVSLFPSLFCLLCIAFPAAFRI
jgi:hypothetical protein